MKKSYFVANSMLTTGIVMLLIGALAIVCGENIFDYMLQIIGAVIAAASLALLIVYFMMKNTHSTFVKTLVVIASVFLITDGVLVYCYAKELVDIFAIIIGALILLGSIMMIILNLAYHTDSSKVSRIYLVMSILILIACAVAGVIFIKNPEIEKKIIAITLGINMLVLGLLFFCESIIVYKYIRKFNKKIEQNLNNPKNEEVVDAEVIEETPNV